jgi:hypothetical protein
MSCLCGLSLNGDPDSGDPEGELSVDDAPGVIGQGERGSVAALKVVGEVDIITLLI